MSATYSLIKFLMDKKGETVSVAKGLSYGAAMEAFDDKALRLSALALAVVKDYDATEPALLAFYCHGASVNAQTVLARAGYFGLAERV